MILILRVTVPFFQRSSFGRQRCVLLSIWHHPSTTPFELMAVQTGAQFCNLQLYRVPRIPEFHSHWAHFCHAGVHDTKLDVSCTFARHRNSCWKNFFRVREIKTTLRKIELQLFAKVLCSNVQVTSFRFTSCALAYPLHEVHVTSCFMRFFLLARIHFYFFSRTIVFDQRARFPHCPPNRSFPSFLPFLSRNCSCPTTSSTGIICFPLRVTCAQPIFPLPLRPTLPFTRLQTPFLSPFSSPDAIQQPL